MKKSFKIVAMTDVTIRNILQNASGEALGLYTAYFEVAQWQGTYRVKATNGFMAKRLGWGIKKLIKYKKQLMELGVVENYTTKSDNNAVTGHYITINHLVNDSQSVQNPHCGDSTLWENDTQVLLTGNKSTLNKKEVLENEEKDSNELKEKFELIRVWYREKLQGKVKGLDTEFENIKKKYKNLDIPQLEKIVEGMSAMLKEYKEKVKEYESLPEESKKFRKHPKNFQPHFQTFINQRKWEHYIND